ncbi:hypothetical protein A3H38_04090 [candidate division WOR-1 bacterium RIFCSPLOWO2_02_FULL_46_20]|uniref:Uncharacterized protein n=2 Tax=Saganbacteria TaxID=1703751 RepID=A0A1F4RHM0_UNCSA|nr:MAG: hypothetical protein A3J44_01555 [candidate division WOR-1 bacterium RIFCSPHIGHO2_02_FULL_45_12]OGC07669.1 MAG: hypothetical protein A3H38_04090 [candidate division WOR-1 bacterium RIFCSPLOWO2_02_FULL_46_20]OGC08241.1 MAG: hypothetical protein A3F86_05640 [candidate division WOR-1 bacterium RIFCSPLOWO2_12_FULL_45_9]
MTVAPKEEVKVKVEIEMVAASIEAEKVMETPERIDTDVASLVGENVVMVGALLEVEEVAPPQPKIK